MSFADISLFIVVAAVLGLIARTLKQPLIIGYLIAGILLSWFGLIKDHDSLMSLSNIGIALLLFLLGLEMKLKELPDIGRVALLTGIGQIVFTSSVGFILAILLGFDTLPAVYIAVALTFSSTIIIVKLLSEKKDLGSLYGRIAVGFLLVQDFVAVIILMLLSGLGSGSTSFFGFVLISLKAVALLFVVWFLSKRILPHLFNKIIARSNELLYIASIAWALGVAGFVAGPLGFSIEIGGFLAGIALSNLPEHLQIASRTRPLRDFFLVIFFLSLGAQLVVGPEVLAMIGPALLLSMFVLIGNPIIVLIIMGFLGYRKRTAFLAGLTVAQISEFSLILMNMGRNLGHFGDSEVSMVIMVGIVTMTTSTYMILGSDKLYKYLDRYLSIFEFSSSKENVFIKESKKSGHTILIGVDRTGSSLLSYLNKKGIDVLAIDFNPYVYQKLTANNVDVIFGDMSDIEILEAANLEQAKLIISTTSHFSANLIFLEHLRSLSKKPVTIFTSNSRYDAIKLYEAGAGFVIVPDVVAGDHIKHILESYGSETSKILEKGKNNFINLIS